MLSPDFFFKSLKQNDIAFFAGVPDSLLKNICAYLTDSLSEENHIIAANEGGAIGVAAGYYLATGKIPVVYMQNSGLGNAINPLLSLIDKKVYNIPLLLLIGWRGEPGVKDEPQHIKQGEVTLSLLDSMGIKHVILSDDEELFKEQLNEGIAYMNKSREPLAFIVRKGLFEDYKLQSNVDRHLTLTREKSVQLVTSSLENNDIIVSTTGMISRELYEYREACQQKHEKDFLTVGSMGHASQIALGIALQKKDRKIYCFDGDGSVIMHMGGMAIIASKHPSNLIHIVFNNGAHDSVGGQDTVGLDISITGIARECGYKSVFSAQNEKELLGILHVVKKSEGPILLDIKVRKGSRKELGRPKTTPIENKDDLMTFLRDV